MRSAISLALLKFASDSGVPKSPDASLRVPHTESDWHCGMERVWLARLGKLSFKTGMPSS